MWWSGSVRVKPSISGNLKGVLVFLAIELGWREEERGGCIVCTVMGILAGSMSSRMGFKYW